MSSSAAAPPVGQASHVSSVLGKQQSLGACFSSTWTSISRVVGADLRTAWNAAKAAPSWSKKYLLVDTFQFYKANPKMLYKEIISGFAVATMQVPESIAFSFVANVHPLSGLHATFWMALITGIMGGKPGMISGAAGALAVVIRDLTSADGLLDYLTKSEQLKVLYMTVFILGIIQMLFALFRAAKLMRLIPETAMIGFMNGLAIVIFLAQLTVFQKCSKDGVIVEFSDCATKDLSWMSFNADSTVLSFVIVHVVITMFIMHFFVKIPAITLPKIGKIFPGKMVPPSLVALIIGTVIEQVLFRNTFDQGTRTVGDTTSVSGSLPSFNFPSDMPWDSKTVGVMLQMAVTLAAIGGVESVLTLQAVNELTDTVTLVRHNTQELFAQGLANSVCGCFTAMGGDAMIGQSVINILNGARYRVSSTMSGVFILLFVVVLSPLIELLPIATLTATIAATVVLSTFQWQTFRILRYGKLSDSFVIVLVTVVAVFTNLAIAIIAGVFFSAAVQAWDAGSLIDADVTHKSMKVNGKDTPCKYMHITGSLFFGSTKHFISFFNITDDPSVVIVDFGDSMVVDHSAVAAIHGVTHRYRQAGKTVLLTNLNKRSHKVLGRTGDRPLLADQIRRESQMRLVDNLHSPSKKPMAATTKQIPSLSLDGTDEAANAANGEDAPLTISIEVPSSTTQPSSAPSGSPHKRDGSASVGTTVSELPMFSAPAKNVEAELEALGQDQPLIEDVDGDKNLHSKDV
jgi:SulP family sulfate permease